MGETLKGWFVIPAQSWYLPLDAENDWNKLTGITLAGLFEKPNQDAIMIAWRPTAAGKFQATIYSNRNFQHYVSFEAWSYEDLQGQDWMLEFLPGERVEFEVQWRQDVTCILRTENEEQSTQAHYFAISDNKGRVVSPWFGGQKAAPQRIEIVLNYEITS